MWGNVSQGTVGFQRNIPRLPILQPQDVVSPQCVPVHQGVLARGSLLLLGKTAWVFFAISAFFLDFFFFLLETHHIQKKKKSYSLQKLFMLITKCS